MRTFEQKPKMAQSRTAGRASSVSRPRVAQRYDQNSILYLQRSIGNQAVQRLLQDNAEERKAILVGKALPRLEHDCARTTERHPIAGGIQAKLAMNKPGDEYEQEADRIAEQVMRMPEPQRPPACPCGGGCPKCQTNQPGQKRERLQTKQVRTSTTQHVAVPPIVHDALQSPGQPLQPAMRAFMESRFDHDFSQVRVHTGSAAEESSRDVNARAYTVGQNIVFGAGQFAPGTSDGKKLFAHELTHVLQQRGDAGRGTTSEQPLIQRDFINDVHGNPLAYEFRIGNELEADFVTLARTLTSDGSVSDDDLRQLRRRVLMRRGTVDDHERMFMAGLLDRANVATFNGTAPGADFQFPTATITSARRDHVNNLDRALPQPVQQEVDDLTAALVRLDPAGVLAEVSQVEAASARAIVSGAGSFHAQASSLLIFIAANGITAFNTLTAMIQAASDNSRGDRVLAGIVYAIASNAGHPFAGRLAKGEIKVDALVPRALAAIPGMTGREEAAYVTAAQAGGAKGDTMYVKTDLDINNVYHRSVVIHELQHAQDDAASNATGRPTFPIRNQLEARAYRSQARYIYDQLNSEPVATRPSRAREVARGMNGAVAVALVLEGQGNSPRNRPLFGLINQQVPATQRLTARQVSTFFSASTAALETRLLTVINTMYRLSNTDPGVTEGLAGESIMDWIFRL